MTASIAFKTSDTKMPKVVVEAAYDAASRLVDSMLHDARNPLNALAIHLEVLAQKLRDADGEIPPSQEKNLKAMREQIFRVDHVLKQFSEFIAPRLGEGGDVDFSELVRNCLDVLGHEGRKRRVKMVSQIEPNLQLRAHDGGASHWLVLHAIYRALIRTPAGGQVEVTCLREDSRILLRVKDSGDPGPEPEPDTLAALDVLSQEQGVRLRIAACECELSL